VKVGTKGCFFHSQRSSLARCFLDHMGYNFNIRAELDWAVWLTSVIPATQEAEIRMIMV
jgi:hypothetical protein